MGKATRLVQAIRGKAAKAAGSVSDTTTTTTDSPAPAPNSMTNLILADVLLRTGERLLRQSVETGVLGQKSGKFKGKDKATKIVRGGSMAKTLIGTAIARIASRSVPGAIIVGGGLLAKTLYDRRKGAKAAQKASKRLKSRWIKTENPGLLDRSDPQGSLTARARLRH